MADELALRRLHPLAIRPQRMSAQAAGLDLAACLPDGETLTIEPGGRVRVPTGWAVAIPAGFEGQVRPRSGLAWKQGISVLNAPGTIDADYRGELMVLLVNLGSEVATIGHGDRVAQLVVCPVAMVECVEVEELPGVGRGGGFGSTGV